MSTDVNTDIATLVTTLFNQQMDQAKEMFDQQMELSVENTSNTNRMAIFELVRSRAASATQRAFNIGTDAFVNHVESVHRDEENRLRPASAAIPQPEFAPTSVSTSYGLPGVPGVPQTPWGEASSHAERMNEILATVENGGIDALSDEDRDYLQNHDVALSEPAIRDEAESAQRTADAYQSEIDRTPAPDIDEMEDGMGEVINDFNAGNQEMLDTKAHKERMEELAEGVHGIYTVYMMDDDNQMQPFTWDELENALPEADWNYLEQHVDTDNPDVIGEVDAALVAAEEAYDQAVSDQVNFIGELPTEVPAGDPSDGNQADEIREDLGETFDLDTDTASASAMSIASADLNADDEGDEDDAENIVAGLGI